MNDTERDMRITRLEERVTHLAQDSSSMWMHLGDLSRRLVALRHRLYLLGQSTKTSQEVTNE